jgi:5S rRNA maturation endonuclease (ribonuclease M5)
MNLSQAIASRFNVSISWDKGWITVPCPIHLDNKASAGLNFKDKIFNCFGGCGAITFYSLAEQLKIKFDLTDNEEWENNTQDWLNKLISDTTPVPPKPLKVQAQIYTDWLLSKKLKPETIEALGGQYINDINNQNYGHLIIEYEKGKTFRRRIIDGEGKPHKNRKGVERAFLSKECNRYDTIILCEGFTDYATLYQIGFHNIAATLGAGISKRDIYRLYGKTVFVLFDVDYAGHQGTETAIKYIREFKGNPIPLRIPERFRNGDESKIDINSAYVYDSLGFTEWVNTELSNHNKYDNGYMANTFLANHKNFTYIKTAIPSLDAALNGGFATGLHAIAGMPGVGKTTLKTYLIDICESQGSKVLSLDYELTKEQNYARLASRKSRYGWADIEKDHSILEKEVIDYLNKLSTNIRIENGWTIEQIMLAAKNFDVVFIDYVQRMPYNGDDERAGIKYNCRQLGNLARETGKIIFIFSSIPRSMYDKTGKGIFKETGDIEFIIQSGWLLSKFSQDIIEMTCLKNTRGKEDVQLYLSSNYAHQRLKEQLKPELRSML